MVRPPQGDGRLGIAIGLSSVAVRIANLTLAPGAPMPCRTKYTLDYNEYQIDSPKNMWRFWRWTYQADVDDARWAVANILIIFHAGPVADLKAVIADGSTLAMRRASCTQTGCERCAQGVGGYVLQRVCHSPYRGRRRARDAARPRTRG